MVRIGFIGLGTMGGAMARHLLRKAGPIAVWSRNPERSSQIATEGAVPYDTPEGMASEVEALILCVNRTEDVQEIVSNVEARLKPGSLVIDHSTISPAAAAQIAERLGAKGLAFVDAPITGGSMGAQKGQLTIFMGGAEHDCARALSLVGPYTKRAERVGGSGAGQMAKMANQIAVAGSLLGLCECLSFAGKAGLDLRQMRELIGGGAAGSWAFEHYGPKILEKDWSPGFSIKNQRKDFAYCREAARQVNAAIPGTLLVDKLLEVLDKEGRGEETTAALFEVLAASGSALD